MLTTRPLVPAAGCVAVLASAALIRLPRWAAAALLVATGGWSAWRFHGSVTAGPYFSTATAVERREGICPPAHPTCVEGTQHQDLLDEPKPLYLPDDDK